MGGQYNRMNENESRFHKERIRQEIIQVGERADALERILPSIADAETKRKIEQVIESYRLHANRLSEHIRDWDRD